MARGGPNRTTERRSRTNDNARPGKRSVLRERKGGAEARRAAPLEQAWEVFLLDEDWGWEEPEPGDFWRETEDRDS